MSDALQAIYKAMQVHPPAHERVAHPHDTDTDTGYCEACLRFKVNAAMPHIVAALVGALEKVDPELDISMVEVNGEVDGEWMWPEDMVYALNAAWARLCQADTR